MNIDKNLFRKTSIILRKQMSFIIFLSLITNKYWELISELGSVWKIICN